MEGGNFDPDLKLAEIKSLKDLLNRLNSNSPTVQDKAVQEALRIDRVYDADKVIQQVEEIFRIARLKMFQVIHDHLENGRPENEQFARGLLERMDFEGCDERTPSALLQEMVGQEIACLVKKNRTRAPRV